jgi:hypothetical protein
MGRVARITVLIIPKEIKKETLIYLNHFAQISSILVVVITSLG